MVLMMTTSYITDSAPATGNSFDRECGEALGGSSFANFACLAGSSDFLGLGQCNGSYEKEGEPLS
jgi:hypothetical protein